MGTRADFWKHTDGSDGWMGSIGWDGYPDGIPENLLMAETVEEFTEVVGDFLGDREDATLPARGWPWPWDNSATTDYAYVWAGKDVEVYCFGGPEGAGDEVEWPDMSEVKNVARGAGSGLITFGMK